MHYDTNLDSSNINKSIRVILRNKQCKSADLSSWSFCALHIIKRPVYYRNTTLQKELTDIFFCPMISGPRTVHKRWAVSQFHASPPLLNCLRPKFSVWSQFSACKKPGGFCGDCGVRLGRIPPIKSVNSSQPPTAHLLIPPPASRRRAAELSLMFLEK